jgi:hypothetical protein
MQNPAAPFLYHLLFLAASFVTYVSLIAIIYNVLKRKKPENLHMAAAVDTALALYIPSARDSWCLVRHDTTHFAVIHQVYTLQLFI